MSIGPTKVFYVGVASGASTSSFIDLGDRPFTNLAIAYVTMSTGAIVSVFGCDTATGTYGPVYERVPSTATAQYNAVTVPTAVSGGWGVIGRPPFQYIKLCTTAVVSGGVSFTVIAGE